MKRLPIPSSVPIPPGVKMEFARQLKAREEALPGELAEGLDHAPEALLALQTALRTELEHIRYAQTFLELYG